MKSIIILKSIDCLLNSNYFYISNNFFITQTAKTKIEHCNPIDGVIVYDKEAVKRAYNEKKISSVKLSINEEFNKIELTFCFTFKHEIDCVHFSDITKVPQSILDGKFNSVVQTKVYKIDDISVEIKNNKRYYFFDAVNNKISLNDCINKIKTKVNNLTDINQLQPYVSLECHNFIESMNLLTDTNSITESYLFNNIYAVKHTDKNGNTIDYDIISKDITKNYVYKELNITTKNGKVEFFLLNGKKIINAKIQKEILKKYNILSLNMLDDITQPTISNKTTKIKNKYNIFNLLELEHEKLNYIESNITNPIESESELEKITLNWDDFKLTIESTGLILHKNKDVLPISELKNVIKNTIGLKNYSILNVIVFFTSSF